MAASYGSPPLHGARRASSRVIERVLVRDGVGDGGGARQLERHGPAAEDAEDGRALHERDAEGLHARADVLAVRLAADLDLERGRRAQEADDLDEVLAGR